MATLRITDRDGQNLTPAPGDGIDLTPGAAIVLTGDWSAGRYLHAALRFDGQHQGVVIVRFFARGRRAADATLRLAYPPGIGTALTVDCHALDGDARSLPRLPGRLAAVRRGRIAAGAIARIELELAATGLDQCCVLAPPALMGDHPPPGLRPDRLLDELGQWSRRAWPGKTADAAALGARLRAEASEAAEAGARFPDTWSLYGGSKRDRFIGTGVFRTEFDGRRWWLVDPDGHGFFATGVDGIRDGEDAAILPGTEPCFAWLPFRDPDYADCHDTDLAWATPVARFGRANLRRVFGDAWRPSWQALTLDRLRRWRFNTLGSAGDPELIHASGLPYLMELPGFPRTDRLLYRDLPDVFDPAFADAAAAHARQLAPFVQDSCLIGYYLGPPPAWLDEDVTLVDEILAREPGSHTRRALRDRIRARYHDDVAAWQSAWGIDELGDDLEDFDHLVTRRIDALSREYPGARDDCEAFAAEILHRYLAVPAAACRAVDPHHLVLGIRFPFLNGTVVAGIGDTLDLIACDGYRTRPDTLLADWVLERLDRPLLIAGFHFGALDAGPIAAGRCGVATQEHRALAYRGYVEACAAHPAIVGCCYDAYHDQPGLGGADGACSQIGVVDVCHRPYPELVDQAGTAHEAVYPVRRGEVEPFLARVLELPLTVV